MIAGVAAGIADYLDVDVAVVRVVLVALAVAGGAGVPLYLAAWLLVPEEGDEESIVAAHLAGHGGIAMATRPGPGPSTSRPSAPGPSGPATERSDDVPAA